MRLILALIAVLAQAGTLNPGAADAQSLQRMVATERAFAAATAELGVRDGFLTFFADDAVHIRRGTPPALVPAKTALAAQPLPKLPLATRLIWEPFTGHISSDGTFGWLTGGYVALSQADRSAVSQGAYFSVWKRQPNGTWRVWLDEGIDLPQMWRDAAPFRPAPEPDAGVAGNPGETVQAAEASITSAATWHARLANDVRLHINGQMPLAGRDAVAFSSRAAMATTYTVLQTEAAASGDLAVTIGTFEATPAGAAKSTGTWVRVWKRDAGGRLRIVFQTESVTPK